jgi:hypothetical protein
MLRKFFAQMIDGSFLLFPGVPYAFLGFAPQRRSGKVPLRVR